MTVVCLVCGDRGFEVALDLCHKCQNNACHRYCQKVLPEVLSESAIWLCEDCESNVAKPCTVENSCSPPSGLSVTVEQDTTQFYNISDTSSTSSESGGEEYICEGSSSLNELNKRRRLVLEEDSEDSQASPLSVNYVINPLKHSNILKETIVSGSQAKREEEIGDEVRSSIELLYRESCNSDNDTKSKKQRRSVIEDDKAQPSKISRRELVEDNEIQGRETCDREVKSKEKRRLILRGKEGHPVEAFGVLSNNAGASSISQQKPVTGSGILDQQLEKRGNDAELGKKVISVAEDNDPKCREKYDSGTNVQRQDQKLNGQRRFAPKHLGAKTTKTPGVGVTDQETSNLSKHKVISGSVAKPDVKIFDDGKPSCTQFDEKCNTDKKLKEQQRSETSTVPVGKVEPSNISQEKVISCYEAENQKPKKRRSILDEDEDKSLGTSRLAPNETDPSKTIKEKTLTGSEANTKLHTPFDNESPRRETKASKASRDYSGHSRHFHNSGKKISNGSKAEKPQYIKDRYRDQKPWKRKGSGLEGETGASDIKRSNISHHGLASSPLHKPSRWRRDDEPSGERYRGKWDKRRASILEDEEDSDTLNTSRAESPNMSRQRRGNYETERFSDFPRRKPIYDSRNKTNVHKPYCREHCHRALSNYEETGRDLKPSNNNSGLDYHNPIPMEVPVWRGIISVCDIGSSMASNFLAVDAHLSTLANSQAAEVAEWFPRVVFFNTLRRSLLWPKCFQDSGPSSHHIALYFFPDNQSDAFDKLINVMYHKDLALIAVFENEELVVFTSHVLPPNCQTIELKYFLWGGFRARKPSKLTNQLKPQHYKRVRA